MTWYLPKIAKKMKDNRRYGKFLHLIPDDKFIDGAYDLFETVAPEQNDYLLLKEITSQIKFIKTFTPARRNALTLRPHDLNFFSKYNAVFVHYLDAAARLVIDKAPKETRFVWIGWGADYYHLICDPKDLLQTRTRNALEAVHSTSETPTFARQKRMLKTCRNLLFNPWRTLCRHAASRRLQAIGPLGPSEKKLLARISLFAPVLRADYDAIKAVATDFPATFVSWNYPVSLPTISREISGNNILVGNSADPTNNHVDTFYLIRETIGSHQKIVCPLSYGNQSYGDLVASLGREMFGQQFMPLRDFLTSGRYTEILTTCSIAAMNHVRQQALGNTLMMLWLGARVFLNPRSPVYSAMRKLGIDVYDINTLPDYIKSAQQPTSHTELTERRERLLKRYGHTALLSLTRDLLQRSLQLK